MSGTDEPGIAAAPEAEPGLGVTRRRVLAVGGSLVAATLAGTALWRAKGEPRAVADPDAAVQALLDRRSAAVLARDAAALRGTSLASAAEQDTALLRNLAEVPLASWHWRLVSTGAFPLPAAVGSRRRIAATLELAYRLRGFDAAPVTARAYAVLEQTAAGWRWGGRPDSPAGDTLLWDLGPAGAAAGRQALVLGLQRTPSELAALAAEADRAVAAVSALWGRAWGQRTVVLAPLALDQFASLLGTSPAAVSALAAVTTGELGAADARRTERITLNPQVWDGLNALGRSAVLTHETTHVATRTQTQSWTPRWLSEGVAEWTAYRATGRTPRQLAPELAESAATVPSSLPADADFDATATDLPVAYQRSWMACRTLVHRWGEPALVAFYAAVSRTDLDRACADILRTTPQAFADLCHQDLLAAFR
ncbi:hypothetical protein [Streptacidiphilus monticola]|uniref:Uncharacterized protein n=1 Tax=Streptacidiphilus monticola TaxID=2161674 RepID=A0ABW1FXH1_9ACTN